jgi:hypothetical protein
LARRSSIFAVLAALGAAVVLSGCQTVTYPTAGLWIQDVRVPVDSNIASGPKEGKACITNYLGVFAMGDASVEKAAQNGGITKVQSVEGLVNARIVIGTYCTVVRGS